MKSPILMIKKFMAITVIAFAACVPAYSQAQVDSSKKVSGLPFTIEQFEERKALIRSSPELFIEEIVERKIAFFPTKEFKEKRKDVPKEVLDALNKNVALILLVSEFDCRGCSAGTNDGRNFAQQVLDEIKQIGRQHLPNLVKKGWDERSPTPHVYFFINGTLVKERRRQETVEIRLAYIDAGHVSQTPFNSRKWKITSSSSQAIAKEVAEWVANSLNSVVD